MSEDNRATLRKVVPIFAVTTIFASLFFVSSKTPPSVMTSAVKTTAVEYTPTPTPMPELSTAPSNLLVSTNMALKAVVVPPEPAARVISAAPKARPIDPIDPVPTPRPLPPPVPNASNTIGCQFPPIYDKWWTQATDSMAVISGLVENDAFRSNIMFNWTGKMQFSIEATAFDGTPLGGMLFDTYQLEACTLANGSYKDGVCSGMFQINQPTINFAPNYRGGYALKLIPMSGTGKVFLYATLIDNKSGDCTMLSQFRYTRNYNVWAESGLYFQGPVDAETEIP